MWSLFQLAEVEGRNRELSKERDKLFTELDKTLKDLVKAKTKAEAEKRKKEREKGSYENTAIGIGSEGGWGEGGRGGEGGETEEGPLVCSRSGVGF